MSCQDTAFHIPSPLILCGYPTTAVSGTSGWSAFTKSQTKIHKSELLQALQILCQLLYKQNNLPYLTLPLTDPAESTTEKLDANFLLQGQLVAMATATPQGVALYWPWPYRQKKRTPTSTAKPTAHQGEFATSGKPLSLPLCMTVVPNGNWPLPNHKAKPVLQCSMLQRTVANRAKLPASQSTLSLCL